MDWGSASLFPVGSSVLIRLLSEVCPSGEQGRLSQVGGDGSGHTEPALREDL